MIISLNRYERRAFLYCSNRRLITHLDKCRKQYEKEEAAKGRKPDIVACRFNFSHRVNKLEIRIHESECPDQYTVIHSIAAAEAELKQSGKYLALRIGV